ncbi:PREDICTED: peroxisomal sarcosine oxidase [Gavialis gangeticus]|uniref:peroxisomal sarcosine oxidase n=1 Tax=Gavialis gangeticus TaxID=94835 RepID=UPI00092FA982|nr:PREDICTED: peroxisomal sarcosine oxidase [Gavialis gangeticus]
MAAPSSAGSSLYDAIVVGAGIQGSFAAYHLAKRGRRALLLEQFPLPHSRGSSHGQSRIIRSTYPQPHYTRAMPECYRLWARLEAEAGVQLYRQTGLLVLGAEGSPAFGACLQSLAQHGVPRELLSAQELPRRFPGLRAYRGETAVFEPSAGVLRADKALRAVQDLFLQAGGALRDSEKVVAIEPGPVVTVRTSAGVHRAGSLVIAAGPWTNKLLAPLGLQLPLQPLRVSVCYWKEKVPGTYGSPAGFPCFLSLSTSQAPHDIYGLPASEYPGMVKVCYHHGCPVDPDERDREPKGSALPDIQILRGFVGRYLPGLEPEPAVVESCMYTITPDEDFVLDRHPQFSNIVIGAGFSGHGFKLAPVVGKVLCELSLGQAPSCDVEPFRIQRFPSQRRAAL